MVDNKQETPIDMREILASGEAIPVYRLYQLSDMSSEDLDKFAAIWQDLDDERRRIVIRHMADISEGDYQVDYCEVFAYCLADPSPPVRIAALDGLSDSERSSLIEPILDMAQNDPDLEVRRLAAATLGHYVILGEWDVIPLKHTEPIVEGLLSILEDDNSDPPVRRAALESISSNPHVKIPGLIEQAYDSGDSKKQISAIFAMGQSADPRWLSIIQDEMQSPYEEMRIEAVRAAGSIGKSELIADVADLITDDDLEVGLAAIAAIGEIGTELGQKILLDMADDPYMEELHPAIGEALEQLSWLDDGFDFDRLDWENDSDDLSFPEV
jgi:HEAT repeat protein